MEVSKLKLMKANYNSQKYRLEEQIARNYPAQIKSLEERIAGLSEDASAAALILDKDKQKDEFSMEIQGLIYTDKKQAGITLMAACTGLASLKKEEIIASFYGFNLSVYFESFSQRFILTVRRKCSYPMEMGSDPSGNIQRIMNLMAGIEKSLSETKQKLESVNQQFITAQKEVLKPFVKEEELKEKTARLAELDTLLNLDEQGVDEQEVTEHLDTEKDNRAEGETIQVTNKQGEEISGKNIRENSPDGVMSVSDEVIKAPVTAKECVVENQTAYQEHKLFTLNDLKEIQRKSAERRMNGQNLNRQNQNEQNTVRRDGYFR